MYIRTYIRTWIAEVHLLLHFVHMHVGCMNHTICGTEDRG